MSTLRHARPARGPVDRSRARLGSTRPRMSAVTRAAKRCCGMCVWCGMCVYVFASRRNVKRKQPRTNNSSLPPHPTHTHPFNTHLWQVLCHVPTTRNICEKRKYQNTGRYRATQHSSRHCNCLQHTGSGLHRQLTFVKAGRP